MAFAFDPPRRFPARVKAAGSGDDDALRHLIDTKSLTLDDVDELCDAAGAYEFGRAKSGCAGKTVALLFFQASTRTRLGFEAAAVSLGTHCIGIEDMSASRSNERSSESLEDCAAVVSRLSDAIVVRHHEPGAAARMATKSKVPIVNAGDGWNEHPTQALIDIFSLRRGLGTIRGKSIAVTGDPRGRTLRSLMNLIRYEAPKEILFCPTPHYEIPADVLSAISEHQVRYRMIPDVKIALTESEAIMVGPFDMSDIGEPAASGYISPHATPDSHTLTAEKIQATNSRALLFHPLPRRDEIHPSCDDLPNAMYFEQVRLSKFMRMAVLDRVMSNIE
jgi:aspartate carbamoyltransferase catalytic subunit